MKNRILLLLVVLCCTTSNAQNHESQPKRIIDSLTINDLNKKLIEIQTLLKAKKTVTSVELKAHENKIIKKIDSQNSFWKHIIGLVPVFVVLIAGGLTVLQMRLNNISKARIEWTENLRVHVSEYVSVFVTLKDYYVSKRFQDDKNSLEHKELLSTFSKLQSIIRLYLNDQEVKHEELNNLLADSADFLADLFENRIPKEDFSVMMVIFSSNKILKESWEDAKSFKDFWPWSGKKKKDIESK